MRLSRRNALVRLRRRARSSEAAIILVAIGIGICAGLMTAALGAAAHGLQHALYGVGINHLSALATIRHPARLLALPAGGLLLGLASHWLARERTPIDVVEANALHGGRVPAIDSLQVCLQTLISNGFGASVGLEAAYAQAGGGFASAIAETLSLRRGDARILVGAGAGAAIGAAFGAPLTGAFYAFEIVIGAYVPAAIAPVAAAALAAALVTRGLGIEPYLVAGPAADPLTNLAYLLYAGLGIVAAVAGIAIMRGQTLAERMVQRLPLPASWRPAVGGALLVPIAWITPQALASGHGALRVELLLHPAIAALAIVFALKALASVVSLSFGFRGGLFFASLFLGSLLGPIYAEGVNLAAQALGHAPLLDAHDAALVGTAALAVSVVGGPMTLALLVLEATHDFALTGVVVTAVLCASAFTRGNFGYSFSTWRLHLRGTGIRSARDIGWMAGLTAGRLMRRDPAVVDAGSSVAQFRAAVPLGSTGRVLLSEAGVYRGIVATAAAYAPGIEPDTPISELARFQDDALAAHVGVAEVLDRFDFLEAEDLAVVDSAGHILGVVTETYVNRRYIEESEKAQSALFGE